VARCTSALRVRAFALLGDQAKQKARSVSCPLQQSYLEQSTA
jgi:hypothetical protein